MIFGHFHRFFTKNNKKNEKDLLVWSDDPRRIRWIAFLQECLLTTIVNIVHESQLGLIMRLPSIDSWLNWTSYYSNQFWLLSATLMRLNFSHETQLSSDFSVSLGCRSSNVYSVIRAFSVMIFNFFGLLVVHWHRPSTSLISASVTHPVLEDYRWNWFLCVRPYFSFWIRDFESPTRLWDWFHFPISRIPHKSSSVVFAVTCGNGFNFDRLHRLRL